MSRRANAASRCGRCRMHQSLCVCGLVPTLQTRTQVVLVIHHKEDRKSTNSGRLATLALPNARVVVRGHEHGPEDDLGLAAGARTVLLFPHEDAIPLESFASSASDQRPVSLVVPDGTWRQASKVRQRVVGLRDVPCVTLPAAAPSIYRLRSESHPAGLATFEAIARALRILEGEAGPAIEAALLALFRTMVERTLWSRGTLESDDVHGGIPAGARRDQPWLVS